MNAYYSQWSYAELMSWQGIEVDELQDDLYEDYDIDFSCDDECEEDEAA